MKSAFRPLPALLALALAFGASPGTSQQIASRTDPSRTTVGYAEILEATQTNLYDLLRAHRPLWLNTRGAERSAGADVMVYLDGNRLGGRNELRSIPTAIVTEVRYLDAREATTRLGAEHGNGAILISTAPVGTQPMHGVAAAQL